MFETFYKLSTNPFRLTPDPKFCFRHPSYNQANAYLEYALRLGEGFIMVTGRPGIGKTTLVEVFLTEIEQSEVIAARIASANVEAADLLRVVAYSYGIDVAGLDKATVLLHLEQFFVRQTRAGKRILLIIDEAQGLPHVALEELRLLADLQKDSRPLLQLFLVGQEKLRSLMREPDMEQFQQRVIGVCHLEPLGLEETRSYMEHRLRTAGWKGDPELTGAAVLSLYKYSKGVPRHVNKICTRLLLHGMLEEKHDLDKEDVLTVAEELRAEQLAPMEHRDTASADSEELESVAVEQEGDSESIAELALRMDPEEIADHGVQAEDSEAVEQEDETATSGVEDTGREAVAKAAGSTRTPGREPGRGTASTDRLDWQNQFARQRPSGVGEFVGHLHRHRSQARAARPHRERHTQTKPRTARRDYVGEAARRFGRLKWKGKLAVVLGALLVVNLSIAALMARLLDDGGDHSSLLVGYPEPIGEYAARDDQQSADARTEAPKDGGKVIRETDQQLAARQDVGANTQMETSVGQQADSNRDERFAAIENTWDNEEMIASPGAGMPEKLLSDDRASESATQKRPPGLAGADVQVVEPASATSTKQPDIPLNAAKQLSAAEDERMPAPQVPPSQSEVVVSPDNSSMNAAAQTAESAQPQVQDDGSATTVAQVTAKADSSVAAEDGLPVVEEKKTAPPVISRQEKVAELIAFGQRSLKKDRLLIPTYDSAYKYYQQALILDPSNDEALYGIERIVRRYNTLARNAFERQDEKKSRLYVDRGLSINPVDKRLLALKDRLNTAAAVVEKAKAQAPVVQREEQTPPAAEPPLEAENFFSRLKAFFTKSQSAAKPNEVVVEER